MTGLVQLPGEHAYRAADFDTLVDSPIVIGNPAVYEFIVDDTPHYLVNVGEDGVFDGARAAKDLDTLVREYRRMWGSLPYEKYVFLNVITEAGGGLEHANSTVVMASRWATRTRRAYLDWLELASHEFFHTWNVKRLRPVELGPFDYENEVHTRSLWVAEGFTDYYGDLVLHRAGLSTRDEYLESFSNRIEELETTPGRRVRSVELASFDAWIKHYRPDENSVNTTVSYYTKGAVLAFLLDTTIRRLSNGARSLDDVMRAAFEQFGGTHGYSSLDFRRIVEDVAGANLTDFWETSVEGTAELSYGEALETLGLRFRVPTPAAEPKAWLGITTRIDGGRLLVAQVRRDTPAVNGGLNVEDEILALDGFRVRSDKLDQRLEQYKPGDTVSILIARRERLLTLDVTLGIEPARAWRLEILPSLTGEQRDQLDRWLSRPIT
jgi:predicted metalloprotease with PDZ domain